MNLLLAIFLVFYIFLAVRRLDWAVLLILVALPTYLIRFNVFGLPLTLLEAMILSAFFVWLITKTEFKNFLQGKYDWREFKANREKRRAYPFGVEIILWLIVSFSAVAVAGLSDSALGIWKAYFFEPVLLYILILNLFQGRKNLEKLFFALIVSAWFISGLAVIQKFTGLWIFNQFWAEEANRRVTSVFGYPNAVGLYLAPLVLLLVGFFFQLFVEGIKNKKFEKWKLAIISSAVIISLLAIYFAKSKGALVGIAGGLFVFGFLAGGKKIKLATLAVILAFAFSLVSFPALRDFSLDKTLYSKSYQIRQQQWRETWKMLKDGRLVTGAGLAKYQEVVAPYHQEGIFLKDYRDPDWHEKTVRSAEFRAKVWQPTEIYLYPHNLIFNFWSELGLAGVLLFVWIVAKFCWVIVRNLIHQPADEIRNFINIGLLGAMVVIMVHGLVDVPYFKNDLAVMFWAIIAIKSIADITSD